MTNTIFLFQDCTIFPFLYACCIMVSGCSTVHRAGIALVLTGSVSESRIARIRNILIFRTTCTLNRYITRARALISDLCII